MKSCLKVFYFVPARLLYSFNSSFIMSGAFACAVDGFNWNSCYQMLSETLFAYERGKMKIEIE